MVDCSRERRVRGGGEIEYMVKRGARERGDGGARGGEGTDGGDGEEVVGDWGGWLMREREKKGSKWRSSGSMNG